MPGMHDRSMHHQEPPVSYDTPGTLPNASEGVAQRWVCFDDGFGHSCDYRCARARARACVCGLLAVYRPRLSSEAEPRYYYRGIVRSQILQTKLQSFMLYALGMAGSNCALIRCNARRIAQCCRARRLLSQSCRQGGDNAG